MIKFNKVVSVLAILALVVVSLIGNAKANTSFAQGFDVTSAYLSKVDNGTCHSIFGSGKVGTSNAWIKGGWSDLSFSNVEIWITGTIPAGCTARANIPGFTTPSLLKTGSYTAGTIEGSVLSFFNFIPMACAYHSIIFDTNINGVCDWQGMESCEWRSTLSGSSEYQSEYETFNSSYFTKLNGSNNLFGAKRNTVINGKYQIGVGSTVLTPNCELYYFYQYWDGGILKRVYLKQTGGAQTALSTSTTATPIYSKTKIEANKMVLAGTVDKVIGRVYYVHVDYSCDGVFNSGYDIEIPAL